MNKKIIALVTLIFAFQTLSKAISRDPVAIVTSFGNALSSWTKTSEDQYRLDAKEQMSKNGECFRAEDRISLQLSKEYGTFQTNANSLMAADFMNAIRKGMAEGLRINVTNVRKRDVSELSSRPHNSCIAVVSFNISVNGPTNMAEENVAYVNTSSPIGIQKIVKAEYDTTTGKLKTDYSHLTYPVDGTWTFTYNYSKFFPIGLSLAYEYGHLYIGADLGYSLNKDKTIFTKDISYIDENNYKYEERIYGEKAFFTISPGYSCRLFSLSCGLGTMILNGEKNIYTAESKEESGSGWSTSGKSETNTSENHKLFKFMVRPSLKFYIPVSIDYTDFDIVAGIGYDYVCGHSPANGINFSIGARF